MQNLPDQPLGHGDWLIINDGQHRIFKYCGNLMP